MTTVESVDEYRCGRCSEVLVLRGPTEVDGALCLAEGEHDAVCLGRPPAAGDLVAWDQQPSARGAAPAVLGLVLLGGDDDYNLRVIQAGQDLAAGSERRVQ